LLVNVPRELALGDGDVGVQFKAEGRDGGEADRVVGGKAFGGCSVGLDCDPHLILRAAGAGHGDGADLGAGVSLDQVGADGLKIDGVAPVDQEDRPGAEGAGIAVLGDGREVGVADDHNL
jgi:hypothetical protein